VRPGSWRGAHIPSAGRGAIQQGSAAGSPGRRVGSGIVSGVNPAADPLAALGTAKYALLTTYRRDGRAVPTPVWIVRVDDALAVWTVADSGKVKRIRREPRVTVATCDIRGNHPGPAYEGQAELLDAAAGERVRRAIAGKYGLVGRLSLLGSRLRRGRSGTLGIRIELRPSS
jgi:PPOX class probable F420-dependent enzyme